MGLWVLADFSEKLVLRFNVSFSVHCASFAWLMCTKQGLQSVSMVDLSCWVFHRYLWTCHVENFPSFFLSKTKPLNFSAILEVISPESVTFPLLLREVFGSPKSCPDKVPKLMLSNLAMAKGRANPLQICWDGQSSQELHHAFCFQHAVLAMAQENKYVYLHYSVYICSFFFLIYHVDIICICLYTCTIYTYPSTYPIYLFDTFSTLKKENIAGVFDAFFQSVRCWSQWWFLAWPSASLDQAGMAGVEWPGERWLTDL